MKLKDGRCWDCNVSWCNDTEPLICPKCGKIVKSIGEFDPEEEYDKALSGKLFPSTWQYIKGIFTK